METKTTSPEQPGDPSNQPPDPQAGQAGRPFGRVELGLQELTAQFAPMNITVGDLFACEAGLVYIPLESTLYTGNLAGIGFLVGGLAGGISATVSNIQNLKYARELAGAIRGGDFGVALDERAQKHKGLVIPRAGIGSIEIINKGQGIRITHAGGQLELGSDEAEEACRQLNAWRAGTLEGEAGTQGANLDLPPAATLLLWFMDGSVSGKISGQGLEEIACEAVYIKQLFLEFDVKNYSRKEAIINTARRLPGNWAAAFREHLETAKAKGQRRLGWAAAAAGIGLIAIIYEFLPSVAGSSPAVLTVGTFLLLLSIPVLLLNGSNNNKLKRLISLVSTTE